MVHRHVPRRLLRPVRAGRRSRSSPTRPATSPRRRRTDRQHHAAAGLRRRREPVFRHPGRAGSATDRRPGPLGQQDDRPVAAQEREGHSEIRRGRPDHVQADQGRTRTSRSRTPTGSSPAPRRPRHSSLITPRDWHLPQEPVDPAGAADRPVRDHADAALHLRRHRAGRPISSGGRRGITASRSSC